MSIKIRQLTVNDVFTVARMLSKVTKGARAELAAAIKSEKPDPTEVGIALFQSVFAEAEEDLKKWLADLIGKPLDKFEAMPAAAVIDIVEALAKQEDIKDFFRRVSRLMPEAESLE